MSDREELEAVIADLQAEQGQLYDDAEPHEGRRPFGAMIRAGTVMGEAARKLKIILSSGYTKGNGELVEAGKNSLELIDAYIHDFGDIVTLDGIDATEVYSKLKAALSDIEASPATNGGRDDG